MATSYTHGGGVGWWDYSSPTSDGLTLPFVGASYTMVTANDDGQSFDVGFHTDPNTDVKILWRITATLFQPYRTASSASVALGWDLGGAFTGVIGIASTPWPSPGIWRVVSFTMTALYPAASRPSGNVRWAPQYNDNDAGTSTQRYILKNVRLQWQRLA